MEVVENENILILLQQYIIERLMLVQNVQK